MPATTKKKYASATRAKTAKVEGSTTRKKAVSKGASAKRTSVTKAERVSTVVKPSYEAITRLAFQKFLARGGVHGFHEQDWYSAEKELQGQLDKKKKA